MRQPAASIRLIAVTLLICAAKVGSADAVVAPDPAYGAGSALQGVLMPDGRVTRVDSENLALQMRRYTADGQPDVNFGAAGVANIVLPALTGNLHWWWYSRGTVALPDGSMLLSMRALPLVWSSTVADNSAAPYGFYLMRIDPAGRPDPAYGKDGMIALDPSGSNLSHDDTAVHADGTIVVVLQHYIDIACADRMFLLRLRPSGAMDSWLRRGYRLQRLP